MNNTTTNKENTENSNDIINYETKKVSSLLQSARGNNVMISMNAKKSYSDLYNYQCINSQVYENSILATEFSAGSAEIGSNNVNKSSLYKTAPGGNVSIIGKSYDNISNINDLNRKSKSTVYYYVDHDAKLNELKYASDNEIASISDKNDIELKKEIKNNSNLMMSSKTNNSTKFSNLLTTAKGNPISISDNAIEKSKTVFSEINDDNNSYNTRKISSLLTNAKGNPISISNNAVEKSKQIFSEINDDNNINSTIRTSSLLAISKGNPISISDNALEKSKQTFSETNDNNNSYNTRKISSLLTNAKGNPISISNNAVEKSKQIFSEINNDNNINSTIRISSLLTNALGNPISISDTAIEKSKQIFSETNDNNNTYNTRKISSLLTNAKGNPISISNNAVEKSKKIFSEINNDNNINSTIRISSLLTNALGNPISISDTAIEKSKQIFSETNDNNNTYNTRKISSLLTNAKGNPISISNNAVEKSKQIFSEINNDNNINSTIRISSLLTNAKGNPISISDTAIEKSKDIFSETNDNNKLINQNKLNMEILQNISENRDINNSTKDEVVTTFSKKCDTEKIKYYNLQKANTYLNFSTLNKSLNIACSSSTYTNHHEINKISNENLQKENSFLFSPTMNKSSIIDKNVDNGHVNSTVIRSLSSKVNNFSQIIYPNDSSNLSKYNHHNDIEIDDKNDGFISDICLGTSEVDSDKLSDNTLLKCFEKSSTEMCLMSSTCEKISTDGRIVESKTFQGYNSARFKKLLRINSQNSLNVHFENENINITSNNSEIIYEEICIHISGTPLSISVATSKWLKMQIRWIIWTLASYERKYPMKYFNKLLNQSTILEVVTERYMLYTRSKQLSKSESKIDMQIIRSSHVSASEHFSKVGSMSSLQRCCEIHHLISPLIVCMSITAGSNDFEVSDGWWWTRVIIDDGIKEIIMKRKLSDGTKIAIFDCSFKVDNNEDIMYITINNIRKVKGNTRLGYCNPKYLLRGISIKSIKSNGGPIQSIRGTIVDISEPMSRIINHNKILTTKDLNQWKKVIAQTRDKEMKFVENTNNIDIDDLIDDLNGPSWVKEAVKCLYKNDGIKSQYTSEEIKQIMKYKEKLQYLINDRISANYADANSDYEVKSNDYIDVQLKCCISSNIAWIRIPQEIFHQLTQEHQRNHRNLTSNIKRDLINRTLYMTYLTLRESHNMLLLTNKSSVIKIICNSATNDDTIITDNYSISNPRLILQSYLQNNNFLKEISVICKVVDYSVLTAEITDIKEKLRSFDIIEIHAIDNSNISLMFEFSLPNVIISNYYDILVKNKIIMIKFGVITWIDTKYEIIKISQSDRTHIGIPDNSLESSNFNDNMILYEQRRIENLKKNSSWFIPKVNQNVKKESETNSPLVNLKTTFHSCQRYQLLNVMITWMTIPSYSNSYGILSYENNNNFNETSNLKNIFEISLDRLPTTWIEEYFTYLMMDLDNESSQYHHHIGIECNLSYCLRYESDLIGGITNINPEIIYINPIN